MSIYINQWARTKATIDSTIPCFGLYNDHRLRLIEDISIRQDMYAYKILSLLLQSTIPNTGTIIGIK